MSHIIFFDQPRPPEAQSQEKDMVIRVKPLTSASGSQPSGNIKMDKIQRPPSRVKPLTSASGSQPSGNTKMDKIQRPPSSTQKNKVEAYPRTIKFSLKNKNCVVEPKGTATMQHSKLNANSKLIYVKYNGCMLFDNHDLRVPNVINDVNGRAKSKFVKKTSREKFENQLARCLLKLDTFGNLLVGPSL
nr:hypothetical protein [Tanacetum cinerariifolium]